MRRLLLPGIVIGSVVLCAAVVAWFSLTKTQTVADSREHRAGELACSYWCIYRCSWMLGAPVDMDEIVRRLPPERDGHSLAQLRTAFDEIGLEATGFSESFESFSEGDFPCIVHLSNPDHYVLAAGKLKLGLLVFDGSGLRRRVSKEALKQRWTGHVLRVRRREPSCPLPRLQRRSVVDAPCIQFETLHVDRGDVPINKPVVSFVYPFSNLGTLPLVIEDVETDCKCLAMEKPDKPVPAGARGQIVLKYHAGAVDQRGTFEHEAIVRSNDPTFPLLPLRVSGNSDVRVTFTPREIDFGEVVCSSPGVAYCFVRFTGENVDSFTIRNLHSPLPGVELRVVSSDEYEKTVIGSVPEAPGADASDRLRIIELVCRRSSIVSTFESFSGTFQFETGIEDVGVISVPVQGKWMPPVVMVPRVLDFGELRGRPSTKATASLLLRSLEQRNFRVQQVRLETSGQTMDYSIEERDDGIVVKVVCDEETALRNHKSTVVLDLQVEGEPTSLLLPVVCYAWRASDSAPGMREP